MVNNICQTCLSKDRRLIPKDRIVDLIEELCVLEMKNISSSGICWECHQIMLNFTRFKLQVCEAQVAMKPMVQQSKSFSKLCTVSKKDYDYEFSFHNDPLINDVEIKTDIKSEDLLDENYENCNNNSSGVQNKLIDIKPGIHDETVEVFIEMKQLNENDDSIDNNDSDNEYRQINDSLESNCDKNELALKPKRKLKKERDKKSKTKKIKKRETEKESEIDEEELKSKFSIIMYSEEEMQKHREEKRNHPNFKKIPFKCDSCVLGFTTEKNLEVHMEKKHNQSFPYTCDVCLTRYPTKRPLSRHIRGHFARYRCSFCPRETREMWSALHHSRTKHSGDAAGRLHCPHCDVETRSQEELSEHIRTQHFLSCNECGEKFKGKNTLRTHKTRIHGVKRDFACDICSKTFKTKSRLEAHIVTHNSTLAKKLAYCTTCNVQYKNIYVYRYHLKTSANHSERSYSCSECNKKFVSKVYWTKHYNFYHLQKSKFNCDLCNKLFISDWRLKNHKQTQHGLSRSRDHSCSACGKKFFTTATLRAHQLTHSTQRSFMCEGCGDTFKQRAALYTHTRLVHAGHKRRK